MKLFHWHSLILIILVSIIPLNAGSDDYALSLYKEGAYELSFQTFLGLQKDDTIEQDKVLYYMALCKFHLKEYKKAKQYCFTLLKNHPVSLYRPKTFLLLANIEKQLGNKIQAIRSFLKIKSKYPNSKEAFTAQTNIASIYRELGRYEEAEDLYNELLKKKRTKKETVQIYFAIAKLKESENKTDESIQYYKKIIFTTSDISAIIKAQYAIAEIFLAQHKYTEAKTKYEQILNKFKNIPQENEILYKIAYCLQKLGDDSASLSAYNQIKTTNKILKQNILYRKTEILYAQKKYNTALTNLFQLQKNKLFTERANQYIIKIFITQKKYNSAFSLLTKMTNQKFVYLTRGEIYSIQNQYKKAIQSYIQFLKLYPEVPNKDKIYFKIGKLYFFTKDYKNAILYLKPIYQDYPSSAYLEEALFLIGQAYQEQNDFDNSLVFYNKLLNYSTNSHWQFKTKEKLADTYFSTKQFKQSTDYFLELAHSAQTNKGYYYYRIAQNYKSIHNTSKYIQYLQLALHSKRTSIEVLQKSFQNLQVYYYNKKNYTSYIKLLKYYLSILSNKVKKDKIIFEILNTEFIIQDIPAFMSDFAQYENFVSSEVYQIKIHLLKGKILFNQNQYKTALSLLLSVYSNTENRERNYILFDIGNIYLKLNNIESAQKYYEQFIDTKIDSSLSADIYYNLGQYFYRHKHYLKARQYFSKLLLNFPKNQLTDDALYWKGNAYFLEKKFSISTATFKKLIKSFPQSEFIPSSYLKIGDAYYQQAQYAQAIIYYKKIYALYPHSSVSKIATYKLAKSYKYTKNMKKAITLFSTFSNTNNENPDYYTIQSMYELALYNFNKNKYKKAIPLLLKVRKNNDSLSAKTTFLLAESYRLLKQYKNAKKEYAFIIYKKYEPYMPQSLYYLGFCYEKLKLKQDALDYYKKTTQFYPNSQWAQKASIKITKLEQKE